MLFINLFYKYTKNEINYYNGKIDTVFTLQKQYELKNHLRNVRVAIGDMKIPTGTRGIAPFYVDEKSVMDYYAGGMSISDKSWQGTSYRYGYNAQEKSLEIDASGNHHTAEFWEVDARILIYNRIMKKL
ncbi:MAG: hypothetical protein NTW25_09360 [Candidatus Kapabacteria bacterium]|nr:hypothetical protein [Candidatus Kapabacteria bacterium]